MLDTTSVSKGVTDITTPVRLHFDVINKRAAEILSDRSGQDLGVQDVTDQMLGDLFGIRRETVSRFRNGRQTPALETALAMGKALGMPVEDFAETNAKDGEPA